MYVGVDYYPEHWPTETWEDTAKAMQKAGFNVVRLAEFAWTCQRRTKIRPPRRSKFRPPGRVAA